LCLGWLFINDVGFLGIVRQLCHYEFFSRTNIKQAEKLSRSDEQSAFWTGGVSNVAKLTFSFRRAKKNIYFFSNFEVSRRFSPPRSLPSNQPQHSLRLHIYFLRPFQRAIVELIKRQGSKVIEGTTDDGSEI
jgi:hypothetical protein